MSTESVTPSNHLIFCCPLLLLPSFFPRIKVTKDLMHLKCHWVSEVSESRSVMSDCLPSQGLYSPWNSRGQSTGVGSLFLPQGIFPTQGWTQVSCIKGKNHQLSHKGSPKCHWFVFMIFMIPLLYIKENKLFFSFIFISWRLIHVNIWQNPLQCCENKLFKWIYASNKNLVT